MVCNSSLNFGCAVRLCMLTITIVAPLGRWADG